MILQFRLPVSDILVQIVNMGPFVVLLHVGAIIQANSNVDGYVGT